MEDDISDMLRRLSRSMREEPGTIVANSKAEKEAMMAAMNAGGEAVAVDPLILVERIDASSDDDPRDCPYEFITPEERTAMITTTELMMGLHTLNEFMVDYHIHNGDLYQANKAAMKSKALMAAAMMLTEEIGHVTKHQFGKGHH